MKKNILKIKFLKYPLMKTQQRLVDILREKFSVQLVDKDPDFLVCSAFDTIEVLKYPDMVSILFTGENICPDFNVFDYAIGFDDLTFGDRYLRLPLYCFYPDFDSLCKGATLPESYEMMANRKFCSFVVSNGNGSDPIRAEFFKELNKYKKVDSAGRYMNNMGGGYLEDKRSFISEYKFNIAFENSSVLGYTTEKIMEPMVVNSIPIYWGNKDVAKDFNTESFVNLHDYSSIEACISHIIELDQDDDKYMSMLKQPWFNPDSNYFDYKTKLCDFFENIIDKPVSERKYTTQFGYQPYYRDKITLYHWMQPYSTPLRYVEGIRKKLKEIIKTR